MPDVMAGFRADALDLVRTRLVKDRGLLEESPLLSELLARGFEEKLLELYEAFQGGECSLDYLAEQLGIGTWDAYHILENRGLKTTNL